MTTSALVKSRAYSGSLRLGGLSGALSVSRLLVAAAALGASPAAWAEVRPLVADVIYSGGKIVTIDDKAPTAEAVAVRDGVIVGVGSKAEVETLAGATTKRVDLKGGTMLPGFYDNHVHLTMALGDPRRVEWGHIKSKEELYRELRAAAAKTPKGGLILARLDNENMPNARMPNRWELDKVVPDHPVLLNRQHLGAANSLAMRIAKIDRDTVAPNPEFIVKDEKGEPIGQFREGGSMMVLRAFGPAPAFPKDRATAILRKGIDELSSLGITSFQTAGDDARYTAVLQEMYKDHGDELPRLTFQFRVTPGHDSGKDPEKAITDAITELESLNVLPGFGNDRIKLGSLKMSIDGGFSSAAYYTLEPYPTHTEPYYGVVRIDPEALYRVSKRAHDKGWQLGIHAIGDGAVKMVTDVYDRILKENPREDHRHFIHHVSVLPPEETLKTIAADHILVASQPNLMYALGPVNAAPGLTPERLQTNNPQRSLFKHGIRVSYGSDGMPTGPLVGIYAAVTRKAHDGKTYGYGEHVTIEEAVRAYTLEPAYLTFDEKTRGSIELGKVGDFVVLGQDIMTIDPEKIMTIPVEMTIVGGKTTYTRQK